jgi:hypothetical protein
MKFCIGCEVSVSRIKKSDITFGGAYDSVEEYLEEQLEIYLRDIEDLSFEGGKDYIPTATVSQIEIKRLKKKRTYDEEDGG